jgi:hypothetical protein
VKEQELPRTPAWAGGRKDDGFVTESDDETKEVHEDGTHERDAERNYTRTSISSFPESSYPTDYEPSPMHKPYTPTYSRPSTRRMQMSSPLRKGRLGTPQSEPRGSPRSRRRDYDLDEEPKRLPLVLLHITVLPVNLPWTVQVMREVLPQYTIDNLQLLKSKLSETVLKRGILIPHPREDYELLEEKLLETLELQEPRISKCGHYRGRHSTDSTMTSGSTSADSGMGDSVDASDEEHCSTCHHHLRAAGSGKQKWSIKVYAANGLMRASAWSAAWSEMERIDVEIMPWIKDDLRIKLDEMKASELEVKVIDHEADELRINQIVEERVRLLDEDSERARTAQMSREIDQIVINEQRQYSQSLQETPMAYIEASRPVRSAPESRPASTELPNIYRPKDIPLSILLRNYIFLLVRKPVNMAVFFLVVTIGGLLLSMGPAAMSDRLSELSVLITPTNAKNLLAESLSSIPLIDSAAEAGSPALSELEVPIEGVFATAQAPHDANILTVSESDFVSEEEAAAIVEPESQLDNAEPYTTEETSNASLQATEAVPEIEADHEGVHEEFLEASTSEIQAASEILPQAAEAVFERKAADDEALSEVPVPSVVDEASESSVLSGDADFDVSTQDQLGQADVSIMLQHDDELRDARDEARESAVVDEVVAASEVLVLSEDADHVASTPGQLEVSEQEIGVDEVIDEVSESPVVDMVVATENSSLPSEVNDSDMSTRDQLEQEEDNVDLQHDDGVEPGFQADTALDEVDHLVTPAQSQVESPEKSLPFSMLYATVLQCSAHWADREVMDVVPLMSDDE